MQDIADCFSKLICVDKMKSVTSHRVYQNFVSAIGGANVSCIQSQIRTNGIAMHLWKRYGSVAMYVGEQSRNINFSGLCMMVDAANASVIFTGDVKLIQAKDVYIKEKNNGLRAQKHILIVPHHGGDYSAPSRQYATPLSEAIISVGYGNSYGHPDKHMVSYLQGLCGNNLKRTDTNGDIVEML